MERALLMFSRLETKGYHRSNSCRFCSRLRSVLAVKYAVLFDVLAGHHHCLTVEGDVKVVTALASVHTSAGILARTVPIVPPRAGLAKGHK